MGEERGSESSPPRRRAAPPSQEQPRTQVPLSSLGDHRRAPSSRLHNFTFPSLSWGSQRLFRCVKVDPDVGPTPPSDLGSTEHDDSLQQRQTAAESAPAEPVAAGGVKRNRTGEGERGEEDERLVTFQDSMMTEFQKVSGRIPLSTSSGSPPAEDKELREPSTSAAARVEASRPWNLRLRRAACNAPVAATANGSQKVRDRNYSPMPQENSKKGVNCSGLVLRSEVSKETKERRHKFSSVLSKDEIAEDFFAMTGSKPPRRPKKRPRNVQKQMEMLYPGFYLCEVTPDLYRIP